MSKESPINLIKKLSKEHLFPVLLSILLIVCAFAAALFINRFLTRTPVQPPVLHQATPALEKEKTEIMARIRSDAAQPLSGQEKKELFTKLLNDNKLLTFTPEEKQEIYRVLHAK